MQDFLKLSGVDVTLANHGKEILELLNQAVFDAVLMDVHMPEMNDFIPKPINSKQLISRLLQWLSPRVKAADWCRPSGKDAVSEQVEPVEAAVNELAGEDGLLGFDLNKLLMMLNNNHMLAMKLLFAIKVNMENSLEEIETMIGAEQLTEAGKSIHKVKGTAGNIGAVRLFAAAEALEAGLDNGDKVSLDSFRDAFIHTLGVIGALLNPERQTPPADENIEKLQCIAGKLGQLLKDNDFVSEALLLELGNCLTSDQFDLFTRLRKHISDLQYGEARDTLHRLAQLSDNEEI